MITSIKHAYVVIRPGSRITTLVGCTRPKYPKVVQHDTLGIENNHAQGDQSNHRRADAMSSALAACQKDKAERQLAWLIAASHLQATETNFWSVAAEACRVRGEP